MRAVDVVVVSYNSRDTLRGCVEQLCSERGIHVIVVDNASPDHSLEVVQDLPVTTIQTGANAGFAHGCNTGWQQGTGEYVLFVNPDARIEAASVELLAASLEEHPEAGVAGPRILTESGSLELSIRRFPRLSSTYAQALFLHRLFPASPWSDETVRSETRYESAGPAEWLSGACLMVRRSLLEALGGFDEGFFMYCEDKDLCCRAWAAGYEVRFEPAATCVHLGGGGKSGPRPGLLPVLAGSRIRYARKHAGRPVAAAERLGIALGSLTHAMAGRRDARRGQMRAFLRALRGT